MEAPVRVEFKNQDEGAEVAGSAAANPWDNGVALVAILTGGQS